MCSQAAADVTSYRTALSDNWHWHISQWQWHKQLRHDYHFSKSVQQLAHLLHDSDKHLSEELIIACIKLSQASNLCQAL
jgi:hypothetical protein